MPLLDFLRRKAIAPDALAGATVTLADEHRTRYSTNTKARELLDYCVGLPLTLGDLNARNVTAVPCRLYRMEKLTGGPKYRGDRRVSKARLRAFAEGRHGAKAGEWASIGGDVVEVTDHPVLDLLNRPNPQTGGTAHDHSLVVDLQHFGECFEGAADWDQGPNGAALYRLPAPYTEPDITSADGLEFVRGYWYGRERSRITDIDADYVGHYMLARALTDPWHGRGFLETCYLAAAALAETEAFQADEAKRGFRPALAIQTTGMTDDQKRAAEDSLMSRLRSGAGKAIRMLWINNPANSGHGVTDIKPLALNHRELQSIEMIGEQRRRVLASYGVAESMYEMNDANLASSVSGNRQYLDQTIRPLCSAIASQRTEFILPMFGLEPGEWYLAYDDPTDDVTTERITNLNTQVMSGWRTIDEAREEIGLESLPGGDVLRVNGVPLDEVGAAPEPSFMIPPQFAQRGGVVSADTKSGGCDETVANAVAGAVEQVSATDSGEPQICTERDDDGGDNGGSGIHGDLLRRSMLGIEGDVRGRDGGSGDQAGGTELGGGSDGKAHQRGLLHDPYAPGNCGCGTKDDDDFLGGLSPRLLAYYRQLTPTLADVLSDMEASAIEQLARGVAPADIQYDDFTEQLGEILGGEDGLASAMMEGATTVDAQLQPDDPIRFDVVPPAIEAEVDQYLIRLSDDLTQHTRSEIVRVVDRGIAEGRTIDEIAKDIEGTGIGSASRAERIARTEVQNAVQTGRRARFIDLGIEKVRSVTAPGASPEHMAIERATADGVPIGEPIVGPGSKLGTRVGNETYERATFNPPYRPNCVMPGTVVSANDVGAVMRASYTGLKVSLTTVGGKHLAVTANHKLLTPRGWVAADSLRVGDDLVCSAAADGSVERIGSVVGHAHNGPSVIDQVFALAAKHGCAAVGTEGPDASHYLHGDGAFVDGEIDVVPVDGALLRDTDASARKKLRKIMLRLARMQALGLPSECAVDEFIMVARHATDGIVSSGRETGSLCFASAGHAMEHSLTAVSGLDSTCVEVPSDCASCDTGTVRDLLDRFATVVATDKIVDVGISDYAGHVYDLSTLSGGYVANGIISHNCRCSLDAVED
jgi:hypothetical protein